LTSFKSFDSEVPSFYFISVPPGPALAGAAPNARPRHGAPLSNSFMTSSCSVNRAIRPWQSAHITS